MWLSTSQTCPALFDVHARLTSSPLLVAKVVCVANPERRPTTTAWRWSDGGVGPPCSCPLLPLSHLIPSSCPIHPAAAVLRPSLALSHPVIKKVSPLSSLVHLSRRHKDGWGSSWNGPHKRLCHKVSSLSCIRAPALPSPAPARLLGPASACMCAC